MVKNRKSKHRKLIPHIRISHGTEFQLKLTVLIFWTRFAPKMFFRSKTEKLNTTIEFYVFELV